MYQAVIDPSNNDTVASAAWSVSPTGPTLYSQSDSSAASTIRIKNVPYGSFVLKCEITGTSSQKYDGSVKIVGVVSR